MTTIRRLADSCVTVSSDNGTTLIDPGTFTYEAPEIEIDGLGDIQRVLITHEHADHVNPDFVRWILDRGQDVSVHANQAVADLLAGHDIAVITDAAAGTTFEDVLHETTPLGTAPPNRAFTVDGVFTHPGDSYQPTASGRVLGLPLVTPWGSMFQSMEFARRLTPQVVIPLHDFYMSAAGRQWIYGMAAKVLGAADIEFASLDWGESISI